MPGYAVKEMLPFILELKLFFGKLFYGRQLKIISV